MPINNTEATGAAIAAPGSRPVYTADVVIKDATEAYIECLYDDEDANRALTLDVLAADLTLAVNGKIQEVNDILKAKREGIASAKKSTTDPAKLAKLNSTVVEPNIKLLPSPTPYMLASIIMFKHHVIRLNFGAKDSSSSDMCPLAIYNEDGPYKGIYTTDEDDIEGIIRSCPTMTERGVRETKAFLRVMAPIKFRYSSPNVIAVNNGLYDYENKILMNFDPDMVFASKVSTDYNPNATNVVIHNDDDGTDWDIESWMRELSDHPEAPKLFWQIIGASVRSNNSWNQAAFFFSTKGNNGKGTLCALIRNMIGRSNCASLSLDMLGRDFMMEPLLKASAIIVDENDVGAYLERTANLKALITDDAISINRKHKTPVQYTFNGFMIQCLNDAPKFRDKTDSMLRRTLIHAVISTIFILFPFLSFLLFRLSWLPQNAVNVPLDNVVFLNLFFQLSIVGV